MKKQNVVLNKASTVFLRLAIFAIGAIVLALCTFALPAIWRGTPDEYNDPDIQMAIRAIVLAFYAGAIPFFGALYQSLKLLGLIDKGKAFSNLSVTALKAIAYCGVAISAIFAASLPFFYIWAENDDAPGLIIIGMILSCAAFTVTVFAAVMQRLLRQAIDIKSENELTV
jgi:hypothetical protein